MPPIDVIATPLREFLALAFTTLGLRKISSSILGTNVELVRVLAAIGAEQAGRLVGHERVDDGHFADLLVFELWPPPASEPAG